MKVLQAIGTIAGYILPVVAIVLIVYLVLLIKKVNKVVDHLDLTLDSLDTTVTDVNTTVKKLNSYMGQLGPAFDTIESTAKGLKTAATTVTVFKRKFGTALANKFKTRVAKKEEPTNLITVSKELESSEDKK